MSYPKIPIKTYAADLVWALAVRAQNQNGSYIKESQYDPDGKIIAEANKVLVKRWLQEDRVPTDAEIHQGQETRSYFNGYLLRKLAGKIGDFESLALRIAQIEEFTNRNMYEFAVISSLPSVAVRDRARAELKREIFQSEQLEGQVGEQLITDITVVSCTYNANYNKFFVRARAGESFVTFFYKEMLDTDLTIRIKSKVKAQRDDKTTSLHYVKIIG